MYGLRYSNIRIEDQQLNLKMVNMCEVYNSEIKKRSEEELLEEETRNQQTIDIFIAVSYTHLRAHET